MYIYCADKECSSINRIKPIELSDKLIIIGNCYHCPFCRGFKFILEPKK